MISQLRRDSGKPADRAGKFSAGNRWPQFDTAAVDAKLAHMNSPRMKRAALQQEMQQHLQRIDQHHDDQRAAYLQRMKIPDVSSDLEQAGQRSLSELDSKVDETLSVLDPIRDDLANKRADYQHFRQDNHLVREPHYPESRLNHVLLLVFIGLFETILNGVMLAAGAQGGLLEGWSLAFVIAVINIGAAFAAGNALRYVNGRTWGAQSLGYLSIGLCIVVLGLFNLLVAHYRAALVASTEYTETLAAGRAAWEAFSNSFFGVPDFRSWLLFGFGVLSAGFGLYKGYTMEDKFPGYSRRARSLRNAQADFQDEYEAAVQAIRDFEDDARKGIEQLVESLKIRISTADEVRARASLLPGMHARARESLAAEVKFLHTKHCPDEEALGVQPPPPPEPLPPRDTIDITVLERRVQEMLRVLAERCAQARQKFKRKAA